MKDYKELEVWKKGISLVLEIYEITKIFPKDERYALTDQIKDQPYPYRPILLKERRGTPQKNLFSSCILHRVLLLNWKHKSLLLKNWAI